MAPFPKRARIASPILDRFASFHQNGAVTQFSESPSREKPCRSGSNDYRAIYQEFCAGSDRFRGRRFDDLDAGKTFSLLEG
jgi:hypothetical protein